MKAKFPGKCPFTGKTIEAGDEIEKYQGKWGHAEYVQAMSGGTAEPTVPAASIATKTVSPSLQQEAVFSFVRNENGNGAIIAVAGSGKTTTLLMAMQHVPPGSSCAFVAFSKHIANELGERCPSSVKTYTLHSLGLCNVRDHWGDSVTVDSEKVEFIMDDFPELQVPASRRRQEHRHEMFAIRASIRRLTSMAKLTLCGTDPASLLEICWRHGIDTSVGEETILAVTPLIMDACLARTDVVDFDDMLWIPVKSGLPLRKFDFLFIDEAQDLNQLQLEFVMRSVRATGGRVLAVGDPKQSIFGWAGADTQAMPRLIDSLGARTMPLSVTYRCPRSHVDLAREICADIEPREGAPEGEVRHVTVSEFNPEIGDMVICRTNAPLIPLAFACIRSGKKAMVRGRDIGRALAGVASRVTENATTMGDARQKLMEWHGKENQRMMAKGAPASQLDSLSDRVKTIFAVMEECASPSQLPGKLEKIFSDNSEGIVFSSVHRAKGLEADRVWILKPQLLPMISKNAQDWEKEQEENVRYVALTRSKSELVFVHDKKE